RLRSGPARHQISGYVARRGSLAGADRRHARLGPVPFLNADAARNWIIARNRIYRRCQAVAAAASDCQDAVTDLRAVRGLRAVPIFHSDWPLDSCKIRDCEPRLLLCCRDKAPRCRIPPDLVCNIVARAIYRSERRRTAMESPIRPRFVPDSFHTLSIGLSSAAVVIDKHNLSCVIPPQLGFQCRFRSRLAPTVSFALAAQAEPPYWAPPIPAKRSSPSSECLRIPRA